VEYYSPPVPPASPPPEPYVAPPLQPERKTLRNRIGGAIAALAVLLGKFKSILRREGIRASAPLFIPFMGAFVGMKQLPANAAAEARVGLAGPVLGSIGCLVPLILWKSTGDVFFEALAFTGFFLNLFNLLPVLPLDGGRAMAALSPWMWLIGFGLLVAATLAFPNPIMLLILLLGGMETLRRWRARKTPAAQAYHRVPRGQRVAIAFVYLGLAIALAFGMDATHVVRTFSDV
jgi:Zn-dependent protease